MKQRKFLCNEKPLVFVNLDDCEKCESKEKCVSYHYEIDYQRKKK